MARDGNNLISGKVAAVFAATVIFVSSVVIAEAGPVSLAPHRAVYDLKLKQSRAQKALEAVRGRILYNFSGNTCEGYSLQFRQVSELDSGEGKVMLSDLRASTWEDGGAKSFKFQSQNYVNQRKVDDVEGRAWRADDRVTVALTKPKDKSFALDASIVFPTEHMRRIIEAAQERKTILELRVYDGSETGEKVFSTLTVIGREIAPGEGKGSDAAMQQAALASLRRWPITISYFDPTNKGGEQTPVYSISFELYENGVSRALSLDYGDFVVAAEMSQLELKEAEPCR